MPRRFVSIICSLLLCASVLTGCQTKKMFETEAEMKSYVDGVWESNKTTYAIADGKIIAFKDGQIDYCWSKFSESVEYDLTDYTAQQFYEDFYLKYNLCFNIDYDYKNSKITSGSAEWLEFMNDGSATSIEETHNNEEFNKISDSKTYVIDKVKTYFNNNIEDLIFNKKYSNLPNAREVQYDKLSHIGDRFLVSGTAELDDYYNYGYDNLEPVYFCINIRPTGGSYSDEWYIYADRNEFAELYKSLLNGSKNISLVAEIWFWPTGSNNMATLVDYKK